LLSGA
jgi:hypothetical protein